MLEMILKMIANSVFINKKHPERAYINNGWNILDLTINIVY